MAALEMMEARNVAVGKIKYHHPGLLASQDT
ncbi:hypothetical protein SAMN05443635_10226 [Roseobacter denitrificans OCh 114]|uniref:Uncharacterized protein n=1 Tax=Roseobacter denitrificans (strain ATCC 33942 / OCh 114) TaxID=375451 RepID=Q166M0_ROSDO|nr:hypothetical protein RD1_2515 [Roseobacter denitrificans OCh 114]SFF76955.1 hypothetical protein SAMN05443635_10226 [Roseobacter denitrificans OCh 114]